MIHTMTTTTNRPPRHRFKAGPEDGADSVAEWIIPRIQRYGGPGPEVRLLGQPSAVAALVVRLKQRFGTDGLTPAGNAWTQRLIFTESRTERRLMHEALIRCAGLSNTPADEEQQEYQRGRTAA